jgi:hypothetical protein
MKTYNILIDISIIAVTKYRLICDLISVIQDFHKSEKSRNVYGTNSVNKLKNILLIYR